MIKVPSLEQLKKMSEELVETVKTSEIMGHIKKGTCKLKKTQSDSETMGQQTKKMEADIEMLVKAHRMMTGAVSTITKDVQEIKEIVSSLCEARQKGTEFSEKAKKPKKKTTAKKMVKKASSKKR